MGDLSGRKLHGNVIKGGDTGEIWKVLEIHTKRCSKSQTGLTERFVDSYANITLQLKWLNV